MSTLPTKILLATDGSEDAAAAALAAADVSEKAGAELHIIHVWRRPWDYSYFGVSPEALMSAYSRQAEEVLKEELGRIEGAGGTVAGAHLETGRLIDTVLDAQEEIRADLVILGSRGLGSVKRITLGSVSEGVVHHADCPVLVVRNGESPWPPQRVVAGDDGSDNAKRAGELAAGIGKLYGLPVLLVRADPEPIDTGTVSYEETIEKNVQEEHLQEERNAIEKRADELEELTGLRPETEVSVGDAARVVLEAAEGGSTLVVTGTRGLGAARRMALGSVSTKVLRAAEGPVLIFPHG